MDGIATVKIFNVLPVDRQIIHVGQIFLQHTIKGGKPARNFLAARSVDADDFNLHEKIIKTISEHVHQPSVFRN